MKIKVFDNYVDANRFFFSTALDRFQDKINDIIYVINDFGEQMSTIKPINKIEKTTYIEIDSQISHRKMTVKISSSILERCLKLFEEQDPKLDYVNHVGFAKLLTLAEEESLEEWKKSMGLTGAVTINVESHNQTGGITAPFVNKRK